MTRADGHALTHGESPLRCAAQCTLELGVFERMLQRARIDLRGTAILAAGCGSGFGLELLAKAFRPARLVGFDVQTAYVARARRRGIATDVFVGDVTAIAQPDATFDGVFAFGVLHHEPGWRAAVCELARVLRPGGALCIEEIHGELVRGGAGHVVFDWPTFLGALNDAGLMLVGEQQLFGPAIKSFVAVRRG